MEVIVLSGAPARLRGALTRWFLEVATGTYVGNVSARVRDQLWELIQQEIGTGQAILVFSQQNEQHLEIKSIGHKRVPIDVEGIQMMLETHTIEGSSLLESSGATRPPKESWSIAARRSRYGSGTSRALGRKKF